MAAYGRQETADPLKGHDTYRKVRAREPLSGSACRQCPRSILRVAVGLGTCSRARLLRASYAVSLHSCRFETSTEVPTVSSYWPKTSTPVSGSPSSSLSEVTAASLVMCTGRSSTT